MERTAKYILYDGNCKFCTRTTQWLLSYDKQNILTALAVQAPEARAILKQSGVQFVNLSTIYFIDNGQVYTKSVAAFKIISYLSKPVYYLSYLHILPTWGTNFGYDVVAKYRHKL
ncbi:MAG: DCC1-like thiol-disulfide oxidoreductase family protein [Bacteroidia bacterium]